MLPFLRAAWQEILDTRELEGVLTAIRDAEKPDLARHGLLGAQFEAKRRRILHWFDRFGSSARGWILRRFLGAIRALLDSLLDALGIAGLLREFLDVLNDSIEEEQEPA